MRVQEQLEENLNCDYGYKEIKELCIEIDTKLEKINIYKEL